MSTQSGLPLCACGCGGRTSSKSTAYKMRHRPRSNPVERFWSKVAIGSPDECWPWTASLHKNGYAAYSPDYEGPRMMAHRYAYMVSTGNEIPAELTIDHLCRNRACMNPAHMEVVTRGENARRAQGWIVSIEVRKAKADIACGKGHSRERWARLEPTGNWRCKKCVSEARKLARQRRKEAA